MTREGWGGGVERSERAVGSAQARGRRGTDGPKCGGPESPWNPEGYQLLMTPRFVGETVRGKSGRRKTSKRIRNKGGPPRTV